MGQRLQGFGEAEEELERMFQRRYSWPQTATQNSSRYLEI